MKTFTQKIKSLLTLGLMLIIPVASMQAQCDFTKMTVSKTDAFCANDGSITVSVPGTCNTSIVLEKEGDTSFSRSNTLTANGANSSVTFATLGPANYNVFYMEGTIKRAYAANPVKILNIYKSMVWSSTSTPSSCTDLPDGTLTVNIAAGTGVGPFVYSLTTVRGTQTSAPTSERKYTFNDDANGVLSGEKVSVTVTDQKGGKCAYSYTQTPNVAAWVSNTTSISTVHFYETEVCDEYQSYFRSYVYYGGTGKFMEKQLALIKEPGNATITVTPLDGSDTYTQDLIYDEEKSSYPAPYYCYPAFKGPRLKVGDKFTFKLKRLCGEEYSYSRTITMPKNSLIIDAGDNYSKLIIDNNCVVTEQIGFNYRFDNYNIFHFNDPDRTLKLFRKNEDGTWAETTPKSGELLPFTKEYPNNQSTTIYLNEWGTYKLAYQDKCGIRDFERLITITKPSLGVLTQTFKEFYSTHGNTRGTSFHLSRFNFTDSISVTLDSKDGLTEKTFVTTRAFSSEEFTTTIKFPYNFKIKPSSGQQLSNLSIYDLPPGKYSITVTDKCGTSNSRDFIMAEQPLLTYTPKNTDFYENGIQTRYGCSNSNTIFLDYGTPNANLFENARVELVDKNGNSVRNLVYNGATGTAPNVDYTNGMSISNVPSGDYYLRFHGFLSNVPVHSVILKRTLSESGKGYEERIPVSIKPYAELQIRNYSAMCDPATASGMIDARLIDGTPVYPVRYELFNKATGVKIAEFPDETFGSINHVFTGLPKGEYKVGVTNGYNASLGSGCGYTEGVVVVDGYGVPEIEKSRDNIFIGDNSTLTIPVSPSIYDATWYEVTTRGDVKIGEGTSITVAPTTLGLHNYKVVLAYNATITPCPSTASHVKTTTLNVIARNYWYGGNGTTIIEKENWADPLNWTAKRLPLDNETVEFATVDNYGSEAVNNLRTDESHRVYDMKNETKDKPVALIISTGTTLTVSNKAIILTAPQLMIESAKDKANGSIIFAKPELNTSVPATVQMYTKGFKGEPVTWIDDYPGSPTEGKPYTASYRWQYFGIPIKSVAANPTFYMSSVRMYEEPKNDADYFYQKWTDLTNESVLTPFTGYEITQNDPKTIWFQGELVTGDKTLILSRTPGYMAGFNLFGNSYAAAIDVTQMQFGPGVQAVVYLYNTGTFADWGNQHKTTLEDGRPGSYFAIPRDAAPVLQKEIPSMQGFAIYTEVDKGEVIIPYSTKTGSIITSNTKPQRVKQAAAATEISYLTIDVENEKAADRVWLIEQAGTSKAFDNGWDGYKLSATQQLAIYASEKAGNFQVNTSDDLDGTYLTLRTTETGSYKLKMNLEKLQAADERELYITDLQTGKMTQLTYGAANELDFAVTNLGSEQRFVLTKRQNTPTSSDALDDNHAVKVFAAHGEVFIQNNSGETFTATLTDMSGKLIATVQAPAAAAVCLQKGLNRGAYLVKIASAAHTRTDKIIIK